MSFYNLLVLQEDSLPRAHLDLRHHNDAQQQHHCSKVGGWLLVGTGGGPRGIVVSVCRWAGRLNIGVCVRFFVEEVSAVVRRPVIEAANISG